MIHYLAFRILVHPLLRWKQLLVKDLTLQKLHVRANKSINWNGEGLKLSKLLVEYVCMCMCTCASLLSICRTRGRGDFRGNDLTNIRKAPVLSWCPCRDVWLEALERLTLSFCLSRAIVLICEGNVRRVGFPPEFPPVFLRRFLRVILKVLAASQSIRSDASPTGDTHVFHTRARANGKR